MKNKLFSFWQGGWFTFLVSGAMAVSGAMLVSTAANGIMAYNNRPDTPDPRNLGNELTGILGQYNNFSNSLTGGQGFGQGGLNQLNLLNSGGQFDWMGYLQAHPELQESWDDPSTGNAAFYSSMEDFVRNSAGANQGLNARNRAYFSGGLPDIQSGLISQSRANNINDVLNNSGAYTNLMRGTNADYYNQINTFTAGANAPITPNAQAQQAASQAANGFGSFNPTYGTFDTNGLMANTSFTNQNVNGPSNILGVDAPNSYLGVQGPSNILGVDAPNSYLGVQGPSNILGVNAQNIFSQNSNPVLNRLNDQALSQGMSSNQQQQNALADRLLASGGQLSPDELRMVQQSSRAGFEARGLGATNAAVVDETQNTLAAQRQRLMQNVGLAQSIQNQGIGEASQQQQFGLGVGGQNFNYNQAGIAAQQANQGANLAAQQSNQGAFTNLNAQQLAAQQANQSADLQRQALGLQAQQANQGFALGGYNANVGAQQGAYGLNLNNQQAQQQALMQSAALAEQQRQFQLNAQLQAVGAQQGGALDPYAAILNGTDMSGTANLLNLYGINSGNQNNLLNGLLGYGSDLNNTNFNAQSAAGISEANNNAALYGSLIGAVGQVGGAYLANRNPGGACWVAREVFGEENPKWLQFRHWLFTRAPAWFKNLYLKHGERFAAWLKNKPLLKSAIRRWMESRILTLNTV